MTRCLCALVAGLILAVGLAAVSAPAQTAPTGAPEKYRQLVAEHVAAIKQYRSDQRALAGTSEYQAARKAGDRAAIMRLRSKFPDPTPAVVARFQAEVERKGEKADAAWYLAWLAVNGRDPKIVNSSVDAIEADYLASPAMVVAAKGLFSIMRATGMKRALELADAIVDGNTDKMARAHAFYGRSVIVARDRNATPEQKKQAAADLLEVEKLAPGTIIALRAAGPRFAKERLQVGMVAPDIVAKDLNGAEMKLSDFRGKVVVLDFWGDW